MSMQVIQEVELVNTYTLCLDQAIDSGTSKTSTRVLLIILDQDNCRKGVPT